MEYLNATLAWETAVPLAEQVWVTLINEPAHLIVEGILAVLVLLLIFQRSYRIPKSVGPAPLTESEKEALIRDWEPAPLIDEKQKKATLEANLGNEDGAPMLVIHSSAGAYVSLEEGKKPDHLNLITTGYLNYQDDKEMLDIAEDCLRESGVGACGPRGFYGTVDSHLNLEARMARFFGTEQAVLYSSGFATITSVIPAFAKADDYVFVDDGISFATQTGVTLARAKTFYFPHNDMQKLEELCEKFANVFADKLHRVFVVIEGVYFNHADIAPLDKILELKKRYPFRIMAEESHSVGVLGKHGRGITEHFGLPASVIEILSGSTGHAVGGAGGFSVGPKEATVHQRLSSNGYVFSCSLPPFVAAASIAAFDRIEAGTEVAKLQTRIKEMNKALKQHMHVLKVTSTDLAPFAHLRLPSSTGSRLEDDKLLQAIVDAARAKKILVTRAQYVFAERNAPAPSIRLTISQKHTAADLTRAAQIIDEVAAEVLKDMIAAGSPSTSATSAKGGKGKKAAAAAAGPKSPRGSRATNKLTIKDEDDDEESSADVEEVIQAPSSPKARGSSRSKKTAPTSPKPATKSKSKKK